MKKILFFLFILFSFRSYSGDWELFPLGQKTYFSYQDDTVTKVEVYAMDSVVSNGSVDSLYFRKKLPYSQPSACNFDSIRLSQWSGIPEFLIDSLIKNSDTTFYYSSQSTLPFYFVTSAVVGQSWTITSDFPANDYNQITITCDSLIVGTFVGLTDSVKVFSMTASGVSPGQIPVDNFIIKLSKNYGLIEFVPLNRFLAHPSYKDFFTMKLIGIESDSVQAYYKQPAFSDYFDLSPGDILFWDYYLYFIQSPFPADFHFYYRDSITNVAIYPDSVIYTYDRMKEDTDMVVTQTFNNHMYFRKSNLEQLCLMKPDWYAFGDIDYLETLPYISSYSQYWESDGISLIIDSSSGDTITSSALSTFGNTLNFNNCNYTSVVDYYKAITLDSKRGVTSIIRGPESMTLTGSRINGIQNGNITLNVEKQNDSRSVFRIFPNPAIGTITFHSDVDLKNSEYFIYNISGQLVDQNEYNGGEINISILSSGIYIVKLKTHSGSITGKLCIY